MEITFCAVYTITSRASWAVFPYTIVTMCWLGLLKRATKILLVWDNANTDDGYDDGGRVRTIEFQDEQFSQKESKGSSETLAALEEDAGEGNLSSKQKSALGFIWVVSVGYSLLNKVILSKERDVQCSVRSDLTEKFNLISLVAVIGVPIAVILLCPLAHIVLSFCSCIKYVAVNTNNSSSSTAAKSNRRGRSSTSSSCLECIIIFGFSLIFIVFYPTHMYITEVYFASIKTLFPFMLIKYCFGCAHLIVCPLCVLIVKRDIRSAAKDTYVKKSTAQQK